MNEYNISVERLTENLRAIDMTPRKTSKDYEEAAEIARVLEEDKDIFVIPICPDCGADSAMDFDWREDGFECLKCGAKF